MRQSTKWTYDADGDCEISAGQYIASIGKGYQVVSVWLILTARRIRHKSAREYQGWALEVTPAPEAKPVAVYDEQANELWVRGEMAHPLFWYPRNAK